MPRPWSEKFRDAFRGTWLAVSRERCFLVHGPMAVAVAVVAAAIGVSLVEACLLILCVTVVIVAEMFNTALEYLAKEVTRDHNPGVAAALQIASGAVLISAIGAAAVGLTIFIDHVARWWFAAS
jgi:diacylglycerol kinase